MPIAAVPRQLKDHMTKRKAKASFLILEQSLQLSHAHLGEMEIKITEGRLSGRGNFSSILLEFLWLD